MKTNSSHPIALTVKQEMQRNFEPMQRQVESWRQDH
jgi:hypothetical protein